MTIPHLNVGSELDGLGSLASQLTRSVAIFGSARTPSDAHDFALTKEIACEFARKGFAIISGGGPGIMRAASEGAKAGGGTAVGLNINLPFERPDLSLQDISLTFDHLFTRKLGFALCSQAFIAMPGGLGTLDELFDVLALIKTQKFPSRPVALVGRAFWQGLMSWLADQPMQQGLVYSQDLAPVGVHDTAAEVISFIESALDTTTVALGHEEVP